MQLMLDVMRHKIIRSLVIGIIAELNPSKSGALLSGH